jgi:hypothetical protein
LKPPGYQSSALSFVCDITKHINFPTSSSRIGVAPDPGKPMILLRKMKGHGRRACRNEASRARTAYPVLGIAGGEIRRRLNPTQRAQVTTTSVLVVKDYKRPVDPRPRVFVVAVCPDSVRASSPKQARRGVMSRSAPANLLKPNRRQLLQFRVATPVMCSWALYLS